MFNLTREEMETTVNWCAADGTATIDTADPAVLRKLDKLAEAYPDVYKVVRVDPNFNAKMYSVPVKFIRFGKPASEAQLIAARMNGRNSRFDTANPPIENTSAPSDV